MTIFQIADFRLQIWSLVLGLRYWVLTDSPDAKIDRLSLKSAICNLQFKNASA